MKILAKDVDQNILINPTQDFKIDLGWQENAEILEQEILYDIINPTENYETTRFIHSPYDSSGINQTDIWYHFHFFSGGTYVQDYRSKGITLSENSNLSNVATGSFFRLEFYKTPNDESPNHANRKMVFAKNLSFPIGERVFYSGTSEGSIYSWNEYVYFPVFTGNNYTNIENMYFFWFVDDTPLEETSLTGNTFYMTAKFYNAKNGAVTDFVNKDITLGTQIEEEEDLYYKVIIDRTDHSYKIYRFDGSLGSRTGQPPTPINFYERKQ